MEIKVNGKRLCQLEPIEATQWLSQEELFLYADKCHSLASPFLPLKEWYESFVDHGTNLLYMVMENYL